MEVKNISDDDQKIAIWPSFFSLLAASDLKRLDDNKIKVCYTSGELIRKQGAPLTHIIIFIKGLAKLYIEGPSRKNIILRIIKSTNIIGGPGFYYDLRHHYSIKALRDSVTYLIDVTLFTELLNKNKKFENEFNTELSKNTLITYDRLLSLTQKQMAGRMADLLIYLSEIIYKSTSFVNDLSKDDMSQLAGMSKDNITRTLKDFQQKEIIKVRGKVFELLNLESLNSLSLKGF